MKKFLSLLLLVLACAFVFMGCDNGEGTNDFVEGKVLNIYCWNDEFQQRFYSYYNPDDNLPGGIKVNFIIVPNQDNAYQNALDEALLKQDENPADDKVDIFLIEADYALKYVDSDYSLDIINDIGLTQKHLENQYQYTKDIVTSADGKLKGTSWQACPGLFAYRRSIALEVLGTEDPEEVQDLISDWDKFETVAAQMKAEDYFMLSGYDDAYRPFANNTSKPLVNENKEIVLDQNILDWIEQTKKFTDNGWNQQTSLWDNEWAAGQGPEGRVFGYFYSTWGINFTLLGNSLADQEGPQEVGNGIYGDWAVCEGPANFYWGGTWICAAAGTDNIATIRNIMYTLTCNRAVMKSITMETQDFTNNKVAMKELAEDPKFGFDFLGGQNHIALFLESAKKISLKNLSPYDQAITEEVQTCFKDYFTGEVTHAKALDNFYQAVIEKHPELKTKN